jgi:hypothetical protein
MAQAVPRLDGIQALESAAGLDEEPSRRTVDHDGKACHIADWSPVFLNRRVRA